MRRKLCAVAMFLFFSLALFAQQTNKAGIAPFVITGVNGKTYTYKQLQPNTPTVLIYFSPTCDHCKEFTKELLKNKKELASKQFVMVTYGPPAEMKPFDAQFHITSLPNFKMGTENYTFIVQKYYNVQRFPYVVMYNKQMKAVKTIPMVTNPEDAVQQIIALQ